MRLAIMQRYFFPLISELPMCSGSLSSFRKVFPVSVKTSNSVICLPINPGLSSQEAGRLVDAINEWAAL